MQAGAQAREAGSYPMGTVMQFVRSNSRKISACSCGLSAGLLQPVGNGVGLADELGREVSPLALPEPETCMSVNTI